MSTEETDPKAPEWYRQEITRQREARRLAEEGAAKVQAELTARLEALNAEKASLATAAQKAQAERDRVARQYAMHREGLTSERYQRQLLRDFDEVQQEMGDKTPPFTDWLAEQKKDPDVAAFFKAPAAPAPVAAPVAAPAPVPLPAPAAANADRGVVVAPPVLAKNKDQEVIDLHRAGKLKGDVLRAELKELGLSEEQAKALVR